MVTLRDIEMHEGLNTYTNNAIANVGGSIWGRFGFSDVFTVFLAMDSYVELYKGGIVPLRDFANMKKDNDILVRLIVKKTPCKITYQSMRNQRTDFPVIACAVSETDGVYRASIGARPSKAILICDEQKLLNGEVTADKAKAFAAYVAEKAPTDSNLPAVLTVEHGNQIPINHTK